MRDLISEYYHSTESRYGFMKNKGLTKNYQSFKNHWDKSGIAEMKEAGLTLANALPVYDRWIEEGEKAVERRNKKNALKQKILPKEVEDFMAVIVEELALCARVLVEEQLKR